MGLELVERFAIPERLFGLFALALIVFHLILVKWLPLSKQDWKKVDYVWVSLALLGVMGGVGSARREFASNENSIAKSRLEFAETQVQERLAFGHSSAICRKFVRTEYSPPQEEYDRIQRDFDEECAWFRSATERLPQTSFAKHDTLNIDDLGLPIPKGGDSFAVSSLQQSIVWYNQAVALAKTVAQAMDRSEFEEFMAFIGTAVIAVAVALRLTKVTGEIRLG